MTTALLVDTNFAAGPIRSALLSAGYDVFVAGNRPDDGLARSNDRYIELDYSDPSKLEALVRQYQVGALIPGCNDLSYSVCCEVAHKVELPGFESPEVLNRLHKKDQFRELCESLSIPVPRTYPSVKEALQAPGKLIVKPVDAYSGRGIQLLADLSTRTLTQALEEAATQSRSGKALIEDFVEGRLSSYSAFLVGGSVYKAFNVAEFGSVNPYVVDISYLMPSSEWEDSLRSDVESIAKKLGIRSGLIHLQYISSADQYWLIEPTRRCPGDLYAELVTRATGFPYADAYIAPFIRQEPSHRLRTVEQAFTVRHTVASDRRGVFDRIEFLDSAYLSGWYALAETGDTLFPSPGGRVAVSFFNPPGVHERDELVESLFSKKVFRLQYRDALDN